MKKQLTSISIAAVAAFFATSANASDLFGNSAKDTPSEVVSYKAPTRSGIYITGTLGIANGDRDIDQDISTQKNKLLTPDGFEDDGVTPKFKPALVGDLDEAGNIAGDLVYSDHLSLPFSDDFDDTVFGGELSYLWQLPNKRFGIEFGVGGTFYTDNETNVSFEGERGTITALGDGSPANRYDDVGELNSLVAHTGTTSFSRDYDIDVVAKAHLFVNDQLSVYAGGGLSWAQASLKTSHTTAYNVGGTTAGVFDNAFKQDDSSLGYVLVAGAQYWATDRIVLGFEYNYKQHDFDFDGSSSTDAAVKSNAYRYGVSDEISVDDVEHLFKLKASLKLN